MSVVTEGGNAMSISEFSGASSGLAYHVTAVGIKYKAIGGFGGYAELGFGYNGVLNLGLQYSFGDNSKSKK